VCSKAVNNGITPTANARNTHRSCVLLVASQHRIGGDERDAKTERLEWGRERHQVYVVGEK
jgi:hypothetical protein